MFGCIVCVAAVLIWWAMAVEVRAQSQSVAAPIVREGTFATELANALAVGQPSSESAAESMLGARGVAPRNGWIADYPVTPDILAELRDSIAYAARSKTIQLDAENALQRLEKVKADLGIQVTPGAVNAGSADQSAAADNPDDAEVSGYYDDEGPPIVTYYAPPPAYYDLYSWVPYPFWWGTTSFGGFFILHDFHRHVREHGQVETISNHFNDRLAHRVHRVDPMQRSLGKTFAGIGAPRSRNFISTGVQQAPRRIFNDRRTMSTGRVPESMRRVPRAAAQGRREQPAVRSYRSTNPFPASRVYSAPPATGNMYRPQPGFRQSGGGGHAGGGRRPER